MIRRLRILRTHEFHCILFVFVHVQGILLPESDAHLRGDRAEVRHVLLQMTARNVRERERAIGQRVLLLVRLDEENLDIANLFVERGDLLLELSCLLIEYFLVLYAEIREPVRRPATDRAAPSFGSFRS